MFHVKHIIYVPCVTYAILLYMEQDLETKLSTKEIGNRGEDIAAKYFSETKKYTILNRNYWKKWGEIDIVARETAESGQIIHFIEVKTVSYETKFDLKHAVTHETWRPEELVHQFKLHQIYKALETWLSEYEYGGDWQIDVAAVRIVPRETFATVNMIENIVS